MTPSPRVTVSAFPTVQWLQQRAADRGPAPRPARHRLSPRPSRAEGLLRELRPMLEATVTVEEACWVATPDGELPVDIVLHKGGKRIAVCCRPANIESNSDQDALMLVYGGFDVLYRCSVDASSEAMLDVAYALMQAHPVWFSAFGRLSLGRRASAFMVGAALSAKDKQRRLCGPFGAIEALRLHVASDWVNAFERALRGGGRMSLSA